MCDNEFTIFQYAEGGLDKNEEVKLINHLADCEDCKKILSDYVELKNQTNAYYKTIKPGSVVPSVRKAVKPKISFRRTMAYTAAAATIIIGFVLTTIPLKERSVVEKTKTHTVTEVKTEETKNSISQTENKVIKKTKQTFLKRRTKRESYAAFMANGEWRTEADTIMYLIFSLQKTSEENPL